MPVYFAVTRVVRNHRVTAVALAPFAVRHHGEDYDELTDQLAEAEVIAAIIDGELEAARLDEHHRHHHWWSLRGDGEEEPMSETDAEAAEAAETDAADAAEAADHEDADDVDE